MSESRFILSFWELGKARWQGMARQCKARLGKNLSGKSLEVKGKSGASSKRAAEDIGQEAS